MQSGLCCDIGEGIVAIVAQQNIATICPCDIQIEITVVVVINKRGAQRMTAHLNMSLFGFVAELTSAVIAK